MDGMEGEAYLCDGCGETWVTWEFFLAHPGHGNFRNCPGPSQAVREQYYIGLHDGYPTKEEAIAAIYAEILQKHPAAVIDNERFAYLGDRKALDRYDAKMRAYERNRAGPYPTGAFDKQIAIGGKLALLGGHYWVAGV